MHLAGQLALQLAVRLAVQLAVQLAWNPNGKKPGNTCSQLVLREEGARGYAYAAHAVMRLDLLDGAEPHPGVAHGARHGPSASARPPCPPSGRHRSP